MSELRLAAGSLFAGDYKIVRPLRTGGQGSLYVVEQLSTSKQRALKLMLPELVANATSRKRFELEAKIAARIQSDHVVESIASGVDAKSGVPWLVMELLEGEDLAAHIKNRRALPPSEVLEIFGQLCHALTEAHKQGIVHRDLKPENIFLSNSRRRGMPFMVKVLDFGIARVLAEAKTQSGATVQGLGTPMWMAPEQTVPGGRVEPSTDVWPLGLLAFRLLTGYLFWKAPYDPSASVLMLMAEAFMHPMPTASGRAGDYNCKHRIPPGFDAWFAKAVARNMDERFADAGAAFAALEPILSVAAEMADAAAGEAAPGDARQRTGSTPAITGPGRATWEGAPELGQSVVLSAAESKPDPAPASVTETPPSATDEQAPPVQKPAEEAAAPRPAKDNRLVTLLVGASVASAILGGALMVWSRGRGHKPSGGAPTAAVTATAAPSANAAPAATVDADAAAPSDSAASVDSAAPGDSAAAAGSATGGPVSGGRLKKLCKPAGQKCLSNDDCCDRVCRAWKCRTNAALRDPYGND